MRNTGTGRRVNIWLGGLAVLTAVTFTFAWAKGHAQTAVGADGSGGPEQVQSFLDDDPPPPPPGPRGKKGRREPPPPPAVEARDMQTVSGKVKSFTTAPRGETDGAILDDGTVIHWPPHLEEQFKGLIARGDRVKVVGWMETGPAGDTHLEVRTLTNLRTQESRRNDAPAPPDVRRPGPDGPQAEQDRRLRDLEREVRQLRREVERLRRER